jgi:hypothetical protein
MAAVAELVSRDAKYESLSEDVAYAIKTNDVAYIHSVAADILASTSVDSSVVISKGPDITEFTEAQLLYYLSVALSTGADALATY